MLGACDACEFAQRGPDPVATTVHADRVEPAGRSGEAQFGCVGEQSEHIVEAPVVDGGGVQVDEVGHRKPVADVELHDPSLGHGNPLLRLMSSRHFLRV